MVATVSSHSLYLLKVAISLHIAPLISGMKKTETDSFSVSQYIYILSYYQTQQFKKQLFVLQMIVVIEQM